MARAARTSMIVLRECIRLRGGTSKHSLDAHVDCCLEGGRTLLRNLVRVRLVPPLPVHPRKGRWVTAVRATVPSDAPSYVLRNPCRMRSFYAYANVPGGNDWHLAAHRQLRQVARPSM